ncbi:hypothetical protein [Pseudobacteriovorax antillogorgiicola]|uniref:Uncharacterized protein n=1 Tax=Pseudobacteriovorax antillogorgiicola TaxID=1513793 RepID=A0A1Y6C2Y9_9BACT|nr:hypothetical protein [Pseudobacteriovorax antillogorgiicola]TCS50752.1 hypothetical protein EDD56_112135 [Pseudobacteriovorax antillogorgiicola]SMF41097.1 hypothetical protein SAMN06296036_112134 [Pseudobacteriovorax antillogorgiicola]
MRIRYYLLLSLVSLSSKESAAAEGRFGETSSVNDKTRPWSIAITSSYSETPISESDSAHVRGYALRLLGTYKLTLPKLSWLSDQPTISASLTYADEIGYEDNESNLQNSTVTLSAIEYLINSQIRFSAPINLTLGTNSSSRNYDSLLGAMAISPGVTYESPLNRLNLAFQTILGRYLHKYDSNEGGLYNPKSVYRIKISGIYTLGKFSFGLSGSNTTRYLNDNSKEDDFYTGSASLSYSMSLPISYSLAISKNKDRTFDYNGTTPNINFKYAEHSLVTVSITYKL